MSNALAELTQKMLKRLPFWFKMKKDRNSLGAQFLNVIGMELSDVKTILEYATRQFYIGTVDLGQVDTIYKATIPVIPEGLSVQFFGESFQLQVAPNLTEFLTALSTDTLHNPEVYYNHPYYMDQERRLVYVRFPYSEAEHPPHGRITLLVFDQDGRLITTEDLPLVLHPVWNFLDEFGLLLDCPRLYGERNVAYKERLLAVFEFPANSSYQGLLNGLARDLGMVDRLIWPDGGQDLLLPHSRVSTGTIRADGSPYPADLIRTDGSGRTILKGMPDFAGKERRVLYARGVSLVALNDESQSVYQWELWTPDGHGTARLQRYVDLINGQVPINWGQFVWDQGFWTDGQANPEGSVVPSFRDAAIVGWRPYRREGVR